MATPAEVCEGLSQWLSEKLGFRAECDEHFDHEEIRCLVRETTPQLAMLVPRIISDRRSVEEIIQALEERKVIEAFKSGEHWRLRVTDKGVKCICSNPSHPGRREKNYGVYP